MRIVLILSLLALAGCETVDGIGRDISKSARAVESAL